MTKTKNRDMEWISIKDELPKEGVPVWATSLNHPPTIMTYEYPYDPTTRELYETWEVTSDTPYLDTKRNEWTTADISGIAFEEEITHWQPLPTPLKE